jgi:outer membrane protein TolC
LLDFDALVWRIAANLALPIFQGGRLDAERDLARAEVEEVLADYAQVVLVAFREVEVALTAERYLSRQESALRVAARESEEADVLALERYRSGLVGIITWLEARRRAFNAKSTLIAVSNLRLQNRIALYLALGGDFTAAASSVAGVSKTRGAMLATTAAPENAGAASRRP